MPDRQFSTEQTRAMRVALDTVITWLGEVNEARGTEVAKIIWNIANEGDYDAAELAELTIARIEDTERKTT